MEEPVVRYCYSDLLIEVLPYFLYEVTIYRADSKRSNMLSCKYYISNKLLKVNEIKVLKRFKSFNIIKFITLLGAPKSFIEDNNLQVYNPIKKKKKL